MKRLIDYEAASSYDYSMFTNEDYSEYREALESLPYNPELARLFHESKRYEERIKRQSLRHGIKEELYALSELACIDPGDTDEWIMESVFLQQIASVLTVTEKERLELLLKADGCQSKAAAIAGVPKTTFNASVLSIRKKLRKFFD